MLHPQNKLLWRTESWEPLLQAPPDASLLILPSSSSSSALPSVTCFGQRNVSISLLDGSIPQPVLGSQPTPPCHGKHRISG